MPLAALRSAIAVIPQEPVLFSGVCRFNLDPFDAQTDAACAAALQAAGLAEDLQRPVGAARRGKRPRSTR